MAVRRRLAVRWWSVAARVVIAAVAGVSLAVVCSASTIAQNALRALCAPEPNEAHFLLVRIFPGISNLCRLAVVGFLVCLIGLLTRHRRWFAAYAVVALSAIALVIRTPRTDANGPLARLLAFYGVSLFVFAVGEAFGVWRDQRARSIRVHRTATT